MLMGDRWRNGAKLPWELASVGANFPGRVDVVRACSGAGGVYLSVTCVAVGTGQAPAAAGHKRQQRELQLESDRHPGVDQ